MSYYLTKSNPKKFRMLDQIRDSSPEYPEWWSDVCKDTKPRDTLFIGLSGSEAGIYARAIISSHPYLNTPDPEYAIPPGSAKERLGADVKSFVKHLDSPILEGRLRTRAELEPVADWLHIQGGVRHLTDEQGEALNGLF